MKKILNTNPLIVLILILYVGTMSLIYLNLKWEIRDFHQQVLEETLKK